VHGGSWVQNNVLLSLSIILLWLVMRDPGHCLQYSLHNNNRRRERNSCSKYLSKACYDLNPKKEKKKPNILPSPQSLQKAESAGD
jgi:hypothetical protein